MSKTINIIMAGCMKSRTILGIGNSKGLPWKCKEELKLFKQKTLNHTLIVGRTTFDSLPILKDRKLIVLSSSTKNTEDNYATFESNLKTALNKAPNNSFVIGGAQIYNEFFKNHFNQINELHLSIMKQDYDCDTFVDLDFSKFTISEKVEFDDFTHFVLKPIINGETEYLQLLYHTLYNADERQTRNSVTKSVFGKTLTFDLRNGFPLLTTKKMFLKGIVEELLFFIRGETNSKILEEKNVNIWKGNTSREFLNKIGFENRKEGMMGPMYGYQFRHFNAEYDEQTGKNKTEGYDQLKYIIDTIKSDPNSRRLIMTAFNPLQANDSVLYPCHSIVCQFYCDNEFLDMSVYNRSQDLFHGVPFNIASSALLLLIIATVSKLKPRRLIMNLGDCHIYQSHYESVETQLKRFKYELPKLTITKLIENIQDIENLKLEDFNLENYTFHPAIKADMIA